jgi:hypothetical protein
LNECNASSVFPTIRQKAASYSLILLDPRLKREGFKNKARKAKWKYVVQTRFAPLHKKRTDLIDPADVLYVLEPDWLRFHVAMKDARQHLEAILSAATVAGHRKADAANPARWKGHLEHLLPKTRRKGKARGPHPSLPYKDLHERADAGTHYPDLRPHQ